MNMATIGVAALAIAVSGCTFGLGEQVTFATRNLSLSGVLADGAFAIEEGTVTVVPREMELESGVVIFIDAADDSHAITATLEFEGNLGALCPGARVELEANGDRLEAVDVRGAPPSMAGELSLLRLSMQVSATSPDGGFEDIRPGSVTLSATEGTDGFSRMEVTSTAVVDGEERRLSANFEVARVVESTEVPGWEGDTWNGQPIATWE